MKDGSKNRVVKWNNEYDYKTFFPEGNPIRNVTNDFGCSNAIASRIRLKNKQDSKNVWERKNGSFQSGTK